MDRIALTVCVLIFVAAAGYHTYRRSYPDTAFFGGDTWEYQSMGVNIAKGHGPRVGAIEPFETYRFEPTESEPPHAVSFFRAGAAGGDHNFFRAPGYPYFLGAIYALVGVRPAVVKRIQALLVILVGSCLPYLGWRFWEWRGFSSGLLASPAFLQHSRGMADEILTESLIVFAVFVLVLAHLRWSRARSTTSLALLGTTVGLALLVKGSLIFVPVLYLGHLLWSGRRDAGRTLALRLLTFAGAVAVIVLPYSVAASITAGRVILVSTQGPALLLEGNNELAVHTGTWEPSGPNRPGSFFRRPEIEPLPRWTKVVRFYQADPGRLLVILPRKVDRGFGSFDYLRLLCWALLSASALEVLAGMRRFAERPSLAVAATAPVAAAAGAAVQFGHIEISALLLATALAWGPACCLYPSLRNLLPVPVMIFFANFLLVTLVTFGHRRFTGVMDFLIILSAVASCLWFAGRLLSLGRGTRGLAPRTA
jgi:hypothetical protein